MLRYSSLAGLMVLMSCGGAAREDAADGVAAMAVSKMAASKTDPANVPAPPAEPAVVVPTPVAAPVPTPAAPLAFHPVVTSGEWLGLHPLLDGSLMISAGPRLLRVDPAGVIDEGPALLAGLELPHRMAGESDLGMAMEMINERGGWTALQVGGTWPGATFLTLVTGRPTAEAYRWAGDRWARSKGGGGRVLSWPRTVRAWKDRSLIAWRELYAPATDLSGQCSDCPPELYEAPEYKQGERDLAAAKQLAVLAGPAKAPPLAGKEITAFDALTTGEVFVALASGSLLVLSAAGEPSSIAPPSGARSVQLHGLLARAADDVLGFGTCDEKACLMRHDGKTLATLDAPPCEPGLTSLAITGSTWWTTCASPPPRNYDQLNTQAQAGSLWRREGAGAWERVALPDGLAARLVVARGPDDVWVATYGEQGGTVLHTRPHDRVIALGDLRSIVRKAFFPAEE